MKLSSGSCFPSLVERAKQWYTHNIGKVKEDWEELRNKFCLTLFPISQITSLDRRFSISNKKRRKLQVQLGLDFHS
jgi:hypothetical protein